MVIVHEGEGGIGKIRCPRCKSVAPLVRQQDGSMLNQCPSCGTKYRATAMK